MAANHILIAINLMDELERITVDDPKFSLRNWAAEDISRLERVVSFLKRQGQNSEEPV